MMEGLAFKVRKGGKNHITIGIDQVPSLCGSVFFSKGKPGCDVVGDRMPLDKLLSAHGNLCSRCEAVALSEIEKELAYYE